MGDPTDQAEEANSTSSIWSPLLLYMAIALACLIGFHLLRWIQPSAYVQRVKFAAWLPGTPVASRNNWIWDVIKFPDENIDTVVGLDAGNYIRFLKHMIAYSFFICLLVMVMILPTNLSGGELNNISVSSNYTVETWTLQKMTTDNIPNASALFTVHLIVACIIAVATLLLAISFYRACLQARARWVRRIVYEDKQQLCNVLVRGLRATTIEQVQSELTIALGKNVPFEAIHVVQHHPKLDKALKMRQRYMERYEQAYCNYNGNPIQNPRPGASKHKMDMDLAMEGFNKWDTRVKKMRSGVMSNETFDEAKPNSQLIRAAVITFASPLEASTAVRTLLVPMNPLKLELAPQDFLWNIVAKRETEPAFVRFGLRWIVLRFGLVLFVLFWTVPISIIITTIFDVENWTILPAVQEWILSLPPDFRKFLQGAIPSLLVSIWISLVPTILRELAFQSYPTIIALSQVDVKLLQWYWAYVLFNVWLVIAVTGSVMETVSLAVQYPTSIPTLLATSLSHVSNFYINFINARTFTSITTGLLTLGLDKWVVMAWAFVRGKWWYWNGTPRQVSNQVHPLKKGSNVGLGTQYANALLVMTLNISYCEIQPLISGFAILYYLMEYLAAKYRFLYVSIPRYQSGGGSGLIRMVTRRIVFGLLLQQILLLGLLQLKGFTIPAAAVMGVLIIACGFGWWRAETWHQGPFQRAKDFEVGFGLPHEHIGEFGARRFDTVVENPEQRTDAWAANWKCDRLTDYSQVSLRYRSIKEPFPPRVASKLNQGDPSLTAPLTDFWLPLDSGEAELPKDV